MPRDPGGSYFLPAGNPVVPGTIIESNWANPTMADIGQEITDSLSRTGKGGMLGPLRGLDGTAAVPTFSFTNEPSSGRYRDGPGQIVESILGQPVVRYLATGLEQWNSGIMDWEPLTPRDALGTPFDPGPSNLTSTNVQDAIEEVNDKTGGAISADGVTYDDTGTIFAAATVQIALDQTSGFIGGLATDVSNNADAIQILDGELGLLEPRVANNETDILTNSNNIALHETRITNNETDISNNANSISSIQLEQTTQNSRLDGHDTDVSNINSTLSSHDSRIAANDMDIATNASGISTNAGNISVNTGNISQNTSDIATILGVFPGGILQVANGGTGVTSSTGTGSTVRNSSPAFAGNPTTPTQALGNDSTRIASTAFVQNAIDDTNLKFYLRGQNGNGRYFAFESIDSTFNIIQFGFKSGTGVRTVTFPVSFNNSGSSNISVYVTPYDPNASSTTAVAWTQPSTSSFQINSSVGCYWLAMGI